MGEGNRVIIKDNGKYYRVPVEALYKRVDEEEIQYRTGIPIRRLKRVGDGTYDATLWMQRITYKLTTDYGAYRRTVMRYLSMTRQDRDLVERAIQYLGGLRLKTRRGIGIDLKLIKRGNGYVVRTDSVKIISTMKREMESSVMDLPNLYGSGGICWGDMEVQREIPIDQVEVLFNRFITSRFNEDIVRHRLSNRTDRLIEILKDKKEVLRDLEEPREVKEARELYINKIEEYRHIGTFINLELSTLFNLDNVEIDVLV